MNLHNEVLFQLSSKCKFSATQLVSLLFPEVCLQLVFVILDMTN